MPPVDLYAGALRPACPEAGYTCADHGAHLTCLLRKRILPAMFASALNCGRHAPML